MQNLCANAQELIYIHQRERDPKLSKERRAAINGHFHCLLEWMLAVPQATNNPDIANMITSLAVGPYCSSV
jgi:hypothetical protein